MGRKKIIADRKERIIQSADRLFNHYGLEKTTMEDISREAGIPRATIYLEFSGGKEDILMASIERYLEQTLTAMKELAKQSRNGRLETLKQAILYNILCNHDRTKDFKYSIPTMERYSKKVRLEMESFFLARLEFFTDLLRQAALGGEISSNFDASRFANILEYGFASFMPPLSNRLTREELERDANAFFSLLLSGMAKKQVGLIV
jgi:AcrR family transcriptional regulator